MNTAAATRPARARLSTWPHDADTAHLVLLDHHMVPTDEDVAQWIDRTRALGARRLRTGALFPPACPVFVAAGFQVVETLTLLAADISATTAPQPKFPRQPNVTRQPNIKVSRLRRPQLDQAADLDRRSFTDWWSNDAAALAEIMDATPQHRSRAIVVDRRMVGFAISGRATRTGYIQRLAVDPDVRRHGLGRALVIDALAWMRRRQVTEAMVNTGADNVGALALYRSLGFVSRPDPLLILERDLATA